MRKAVFLDRDGVINVEINLLHKLEQFELIENVEKGIKLLNDAGFLVIVVTNQPVIARELCTEEDVEEIHRYMIDKLEKKGAKIDEVFYCPHHPETNHPEANNPKYRRSCECRKPKPGMILDAQKKYDIDLKKSFMIGDSGRDIMAAKNAGCASILIRNERIDKDKISEINPDYICDDLYEATKKIIDLENEGV